MSGDEARNDVHEARIAADRRGGAPADVKRIRIEPAPPLLEQEIDRAAAELNTVQSNVTARVRLLEEELGTPLFRRHSRGSRDRLAISCSLNSPGYPEETGAISP